MNSLRSSLALSCCGFALLVAGCTTSSTHLHRENLSSKLRSSETKTLLRKAGDTSASLPLNINTGDWLSEDEAISIALWNNPNFNEGLSALGIERGKLAEAGQLANPNFSILFPVSAKQLEFTATFPLEALWLRSHRAAIAGIDAERVSQLLVQSGLDLVRDVRLALVDYEMAKQRHAAATNGFEVQTRMVRIAEARRAAGEVSELETAAARAEGNRIQEEARRAEDGVRIARELLLHLLGMTETDAHFNFQPPRQHNAPSISLADLEKRALAARPDLRAAELAVERAAKVANLAKYEWVTLSGILDANKTPGGMDIGPGAAFTIPIFHQNQGAKTKAKAEVERTAWSLVAARQQVVFEVRQANARLAHANEALQRWRTGVVSPVEELVRSSEKAYELGEMAPLAVQENIRQLLAARLREAELRSDQAKSLAELQRAVGAQLEPSPHN